MKVFQPVSETSSWIDFSISGLERALTRFSELTGEPPVSLLVSPLNTGRAFEVLQQLGLRGIVIVTIPFWPQRTWAVCSPRLVLYDGTDL